MSYWKILDVRFLQRPTDWDALFGRKAPLILEIGFGRGDHLIHLGKTNPDANVIGIEVSQPSLRKAESKVKNNHLTNVRVLDGSGSTLLWSNIMPQSLSQLHVNFPDPWHKEGHQRRRIINPVFMQLAASRMMTDGLLFVATDHPDYQPVVTECLEQAVWFDSRQASTYSLDPGDRFQTKYEAKALREGRVPFYYLFKRNSVSAENIFSVAEDLPMPHAVISSTASLETIRSSFQPFRVQDGNKQINVHFKSLYSDNHRPTLLVETYVNQAPQDQRIGLIISQRSNNEYIIKLHDIGFPRSTEGAHLAVSSLRDWLVGLQAESRTITDTLQTFSGVETEAS